MNKIEVFEDLIAWQKARVLTQGIYQLTGGELFRRDLGLRDQMRRAAVSIMSNIAEGFDRAGRAEFHQFLVVAKGSCAEVRSLLYVARDAGYVSNELFSGMMKQLHELSRILSGLRGAVQRQRDRNARASR